MGITAGCNDFDQAENAPRKSRYALIVARAAGVNFASSA
jgi:hypothetical protein